MTSGSRANSKVDRYVARVGPPMQEVGQALRALVPETPPEMEETIKLSMSCYARNGNVYSIEAAETPMGYVQLQFFRRADLLDPKSFLERTASGMGHAKLRSTESMQTDVLRDLVRGPSAFPEANHRTL